MFQQKFSLIFVFFFNLLFFANAQVGINTTTTAPHTSAMLDVASTSKGLLAPRMTFAQRNAIAMPATGLWLYQTDSLSGFYYNRGTSSNPIWVRLQSESKFSSVCITDFGAVADAMTDNSIPIQNTINFMAVAGGTVCVPAGIFSFSTTLTVPAGVKIVGYGIGATSTLTPFNGSQLKYTGTNWAIKIQGQNAGLSNLVVYNQGNNINALGGIQLYANGQGIETCMLQNILISGFVGGTGLELWAEDSGGLAYCSFYDIRIRHAKKGIHIQQDESSFVNSNSFYHGAISGGGFDYGLHIEGGNNNIFNALVIEPYTSQFGHLVIEKGSITANQIRIEGNAQPNTKPLIDCKSGTYGSVIDGIYAGGLTLDRGNNFIKLTSGKAIGVKPPTQNLFVNAAFQNIASSYVPFWTITGTGVSLQSNAAEIIPNHQVLKMSIPAGVNATLQPQSGFNPVPLSSPLYEHCTFGFYVKSPLSNTVVTTFNAPSGVVTSTPHSGDNTWQFVGMNSAVNTTTTALPKLNIQNTSTSLIDVYVTTPTFAFGNEIPNLESSAVSTAGGSIMTGTLTMGLDSIASTSNLVLPKTGNVFVITGTTTIQRINDLTADRFPIGTCITLLFGSTGISVSNNAYLSLKSSFSTTLNNSTLSLVSMGNGTWREIGRNN